MHPCLDCRFRRHEHEERKLVAQAGMLLQDAASFAAVTQTPLNDALSGTLFGTIGRKAAYEIRSAVALRGVLPDRPGFLSYCGHPKAGPGYEVCVIVNRHRDCELFEVAGPNGLDRRRIGAAAAPPPPPLVPE